MLTSGLIAVARFVVNGDGKRFITSGALHGLRTRDDTRAKAPVSHNIRAALIKDIR